MDKLFQRFFPSTSKNGTASSADGTTTSAAAAAAAATSDNSSTISANTTTTTTTTTPITESSPLIPSSSAEDPLQQLQPQTHPQQQSLQLPEPTLKDIPAALGTRKRMLPIIKSEIPQDYQWQLAICVICFTNAYLLFNTVPYAPFMVVDLLPSKATYETAGKYSGFITSAFTSARNTSLGWWGSYADKHGRKPTIQLSLVLCCIFTTLFGLSTNYIWALVWRFLLGLSCPLAAVAKTCVTELVAAKCAGNNNNVDLEFEAYSMNLAVSSFALAMLMAPIVSGSLSDPIEQLPNWIQERWLGNVLRKFPYLLPNVIGAVCCIIALIITNVFLIETLVAVEQNGSNSGSGKPTTTTTTTTTTTDHSKKQKKKQPQLGTIEENQSLRPGNDDDDDEDLDNFEPSNELIATFGIGTSAEDDLADAIRQTYISSADITIPIVSTTRTRQSMVSGISRRTSVALKTRQERQRRESVAAIAAVTTATAAEVEGGDGGEAPSSSATAAAALKPPTNLTFFLDKDIRRNMIMTILTITTTTTFWEAFPLFCLSKEAGLGVSEYTIGKILSTSGIIYFLIQPWLYVFLFQRTGLNGSIKASAVAAVPIYFLMAFSIDARDKGVGSLHWQAFAFLSIMVGLEKIFALTTYSGLAVSLNRLVIPSQRAQLNALSLRVSGGCMGAAPIVAGIFTSLCFSLAPVWGATVLFGMIGLLATAAAISALVFLDKEEEE